MVYIPPDMVWMVVVGFIVAFVLAFGIGANDVANSFGTSVGSKVLTLRNACILGTIFETLGAILLGARVSETIRKGVIDVAPYNGTEELLMVGQVSALTGCAVWLLIATFLKLPVSGTHSIVGATLGFALVAHGARGVNWSKLGLIVGSWFISPLLSGGVSVGIFFLIKWFVLNKDQPLEPGLQLLPVFYGMTIVINFFSIFYDGPEMLHFDKIPIWGVFIISFGGGLVTAICVRMFLVPWQRRKIQMECAYTQACSSENVSDAGLDGSFNSNNMPLSNTSSRRSSYIESTQKSVLPPIRSATFTQEEDEESTVGADYQIESEFSRHTPGNQTPPRLIGVGVKVHKEMKVSPSKAGLIDAEYSPDRLTESSLEIISANAEDPKPPLPETPPSSTRSQELGSEEGLQHAREDIKDKPEAARLFSFLQILTAVFGSFAHGGNDVSNAIGPLIALWLIGTEGNVQQKAPTPIWLLLYGGVCISIGLWVWGRRVIQTLGDDLTKITPSSGFCIEIGAALTVLIASNVGIPVSTTHCKVGSVVIVGRFRSKENVNWKLFRNIIIAWIVTLPISGGISAALMAGLQLTVPQYPEYLTANVTNVTGVY